MTQSAAIIEPKCSQDTREKSKSVQADIHFTGVKSRSPAYSPRCHFR